jgi:cell wall-associated NlpC family hydrolase
MSFYKAFPRLFAVCFALSLLCVAASAQQQQAMRPRIANELSQPTTTTQANGRAKLESEIVASQPAQEEDDYEPGDAVEGYVVPTNLGRVEQEMLAAIEERLGTPYRMGATGPNRYDCSGFVWSVFQQAGITFERSAARTLWQEYAPATDGDKFKFGTLVFFRNVHHVGIVADANGFFHASSHGVVYSHFNDYWTKRISGFRRIPLAQGPSLVASIRK